MDDGGRLLVRLADGSLRTRHRRRRIPARQRAGRPGAGEEGGGDLMARDELVFAPLGGVGEIGMNLRALRLRSDERRRKWLMVDCGVAFAGEETCPASICILPDIRFIEERRKIVGIVLTHAHEDHIGALIELWPRLKAPVYATPFTAACSRHAACREPGAPKIPVNVVPLGGRFDARPVRRSNSSPSRIRSRNSNALAIRTPHGTVLHTGDWKIDPTPVIGAPTDAARLARARRRGRAGARLRFHQRDPRRPLALARRTWRRRWPSSS